MKSKFVTINDLLTAQEIEQYHKGWNEFSGKKVLNTPYNVHSGKPVINQVYRFDNKNIFRAEVSRGKLQKFDPYCTYKRKYDSTPYWHTMHYLMVFEQVYHSSMREVMDTDKLYAREIPMEFDMSKPTRFKAGVSAEMIMVPKRTMQSYCIEDVFFTVYEQNDVTCKMSARTFVSQRAYARALEQIKKGEMQALTELIRLINMRSNIHKSLIVPRTNLPDKVELISALELGEIPEDEIHNYFSLWDKNI